MNENLIRTMSAKEVAEVLGVSSEAIKKHARVLFPEVIKNGVETRFTEEQVTAIKSKMIPTTRVVGAVTELEKQETIIRAMQYLQEGYAQMKHRAELAEKELIEQQPKVEFFDTAINSIGTFSMQEAAEILKLGYGNVTLFKKLRDMHILNALNVPHQNHINAGRFKVYCKTISKGKKSEIIAVTRVTAKGLDYLTKVLKNEEMGAD